MPANDAAAVGVDAIVSQVHEALRRRGETVSTAESLTGGAVCAALTEVPGASDVVRGGMVVYATDLKSGLLGVRRSLLDEHGPVHPSVAEEMADRVRGACGADWGIGLTGVAGPEPQGGSPVGTVHFGFSGPTGAEVRTVRLAGQRHAIRAAAVRVALEHFAGLVR